MNQHNIIANDSVNQDRPCSFLPLEMQKRWFWLLFFVVLVLMGAFSITGAPMTTEAAPYGVVSFELAVTVERAEAILESWDSIARERAAFGLGLDFLFIPVYVAAISLGCSLASRVLRERKWPLSSLGAALVWCLVLAGILDIVENISLVVILFGVAASPWPQIAALCAVPKFVLIFLGLVYTFFGGVVSLLKKQAEK